MGKEKLRELIIPIKTHWDSSPHLFDDSDKDFHIKRFDRSTILDFIERRTEGALLIAGKRGVGKTSILTSAINEASRYLESIQVTLLPVFVNAANFEIFGPVTNNRNGSIDSLNLDDLTLKRTIIENLVRRLYQITSRFDVKEKIIKPPGEPSVKKELPEPRKLKSRISINKLIIPFSKLIKKFLPKSGHATHDNMSSYEISRVEDQDILAEDPFTNLEDLANTLAVETGISRLFRRAVAKEATSTMKRERGEVFEKIRERESVLEARTSERFILVAASVVAGAILGFHPIFEPAWNNLYSILIAVIPALSLSVYFKFKNTSSSKMDDARMASTFYRYDYDLSNLESELDSKLRKLHQMKCKVVFVIDELDKTSPDGATKVIRLLKTLFNNGHAIFVLITGPEFYNEITKDPHKRQTEYTLFSQTIFLQRALFDEVRKFVEQISNLDPQNNQNAVKFLFEFDDVRDNSTIEDYFSNNSPMNEDLIAIKKAKINKRGESLVISYKKASGSADETKYDVTLSRTYSEIKVLTISDEMGKIISFEFGILKVGAKNYVYCKGKNFTDFEHFVCYLSRSDFFDLYKVLKDYMNYENRALKLRIEINDEVKTRANLQRVLEAVYLRKRLRSPSNWPTNDLLLDKMYEFITGMVEYHKTFRYIELVKDPFLVNHHSQLNTRQDVTSLTKNFDILGLSNEFLNIMGDVFDDLVNYLLRLGFLISTSQPNTFEISGLLLNIDKYVNTREEKEFMDQYFILGYILMLYAKLDDAYGRI